MTVRVCGPWGWVTEGVLQLPVEKPPFQENKGLCCGGWGKTPLWQLFLGSSQAFK